MTINSFARGEQIVVRTEVTVNSTDVTPTTISLQYQDPSGNQTTVGSSQMTSTGTGWYYYTIDSDEEGTWYYKWTTTGTGAGAEVGEFVILDNPFN